jgi:glycosyltransferase involved in cell wall biosynthesis
MRVLFVVQRYGLEINGGAEQHCRWLAEGLATRGHQVTVATSCATNYMTWRNELPPGISRINGVDVIRFPSSEERDVEQFNALSKRVLGVSSSMEEQRSWLRLQGPAVDDLRPWLQQQRNNFDIAIIFTYLYYTAQIAIEELSGHLPLVMHATAHDEPPFFLGSIQNYLRQINLFLCSTDEEADLISLTVGDSAKCKVVGIGVSLSQPTSLNATLLRLKAPLRPYFLVLGRIDESKGVLEACEYFREFSKGLGSYPHLLLVGENVAGLVNDESTSIVGYVSDVEKSTLIHGAIALIQPSRLESFSLVLHEAWLAQTPTLVHGGCAPTKNQTLRSNGGLVYNDQDSFSTSARRMLTSHELRLRLGRQGRAFVLNRYQPATVLERIDSILSTMVP